jgi:hypothetical protein
MAWEPAVGMYDREQSRFVRPGEGSPGLWYESSARHEERFTGKGDCGLKRRP